MGRFSMIATVVLAALPPRAGAQTRPPIRQIGTLEHVTPDSLALQSVTAALAMPGGRVMINDTRGRRVLLLDSTLAHATVVADTTSATANAYGWSWATLTRYRGDTALLMVPSTLSMFVLDPTGVTVRVLAIPRPDDAQLLAGAWGVPGFDAKGRLVYFGGNNVLPGVMMLRAGTPLLQNGQPTAVLRQLEGRGLFRVGMQRTDSSVITRINLDTHAVDTVAWIRIPKYQREIKVDDEGKLVSINTTPDPLPLVDQWTVLRDGTIAVVRARDLHIEWIDSSGRVSSSPKIAFDWRRVDDAHKTALIDSAVAKWQRQFDDIAAARTNASGGGAGRGATGGRGGGGGGGGGSTRGGPAPLAPMIAARAALTDLPDYYPPFAEHSVDSDAEGNLWIETTELVDKRPVFDVVNRDGELIDRVQLPGHRTIAGFGSGVVYMAVIDEAGKVRLERARLK